MSFPMSVLPESLAGWIAVAVLLFWFVGAYNRLVRLRAAVLQAYATVSYTHLTLPTNREV